MTNGCVAEFQLRIVAASLALAGTFFLSVGDDSLLEMKSRNRRLTAQPYTKGWCMPKTVFTLAIFSMISLAI